MFRCFVSYFHPPSECSASVFREGRKVDFCVLCFWLLGCFGGLFWVEPINNGTVDKYVRNFITDPANQIDTCNLRGNWKDADARAHFMTAIRIFYGHKNSTWAIRTRKVTKVQNAVVHVWEMPLQRRSRHGAIHEYVKCQVFHEMKHFFGVEVDVYMCGETTSRTQNTQNLNILLEYVSTSHMWKTLYNFSISNLLFIFATEKIKKKLFFSLPPLFLLLPPPSVCEIIVWHEAGAAGAAFYTRMEFGTAETSHYRARWQSKFWAPAKTEKGELHTRYTVHTYTPTGLDKLCMFIVSVCIHEPHVQVHLFVKAKRRCLLRYSVHWMWTYTQTGICLPHVVFVCTFCVQPFSLILVRCVSY